MSVTRPACVLQLAEVPAEKRPRFTDTPGVRAFVQSLGVTTGLRNMGVHVRRVPPGMAGTNRHFHTIEEEWAYVLRGRGKLRIGPLELEVGPGHFAGFPPGPRPHHFVNDGAGDLVFIEGGESRPGEDGCWYPDARLMSRGRQIVEPYEEPPPAIGEERQLRHVDTLDVREFHHDVDTRARRRMRALHADTGLERQAVYYAEVEAGDLTTALHTHERTDEWVFILAGTAIATVGEHRFEVGPDDFIGHAAGSAAHVMEAVTDLTYLMGGQIDRDDVVHYPQHGLRRRGGRLEPVTVA